jgi:hypothetical protein
MSFWVARKTRDHGCIAQDARGDGLAVLRRGAVGIRRPKCWPGMGDRRHRGGGAGAATDRRARARVARSRSWTRTSRTSPCHSPTWSCRTDRATWCRCSRPTGRSWWTGAGSIAKRCLRSGRHLQPEGGGGYRGLHRGGFAPGAGGPGWPDLRHGFNAATPDIVQIGGVYTPKELRGQGVRTPGGRAAPCRSAGGGRRVLATLFASGASAVAAYEAIGFRRIGDWTIFITERSGSVADALQQAPRGVTR